MRIAGAILAGGASTRMGEPKEGVALPDGRTMIECVADALRPLCSTLVVSGRCSGFDAARIGAVLVDDRRAGIGPLAGIEGILHSGIADAYILATCDQPLLASDLLRALIAEGCDAPATLRTDDGADLSPFPCLLPASLAAAASAALDGGERSPRRFLAASGARAIVVPAAAARMVASINSRKDLEILREGA